MRIASFKVAKIGTLAAMVRRPPSDLGLGERRPPMGGRLRAPAEVPASSRIVYRAGNGPKARSIRF